MFRAIVMSACLAGALAGLVLTAVQQPTIASIILQAETYEAAAPAASESAGHASDVAHGHGHENSDGDTWAPANGFERTFWSLVANVGAGIGFALMLCAVFSLLPNVTPMRGVLWGLAGFVVFFANPSLGLHPEIPGTMSADLHDRQMWWSFAALSSAVAIALLAWRQKVWTLSIAIALLALPHVVGAPQPAVPASLAPAELSRQFIWASTFVNIIFWLTLGIVSAIIFRRLSASDSQLSQSPAT